jgi:hypothetical protein
MNETFESYHKMQKEEEEEHNSYLLGAQLLALRLQLLQLVDGTRGQYKLRVILRELLRQFVSNAAASASNNDSLVLKFSLVNELE